MFAKSFHVVKDWSAGTFSLAYGDKLVIRNSITTLIYISLSTTMSRLYNMDLEFSDTKRKLGYKQNVNDC